jgi:murein DD-endopeptidase MepM/ murein hydrolase activator NlpD
MILSIVSGILNFPNIANAQKTLIGPTLGGISSAYGQRVHPISGHSKFHYGIDIASPHGSPIYALQEGIVTFAGTNGGYGTCIKIDHFYKDLPQVPRVEVLYGHNSINFVKKGDYVRPGMVVGLVGSTGHSTGPHLHFEVKYMNSTLNPIEYLTKLPSYLDYVAQARAGRQNMYSKYR